jgi:hypothetical protein
MKQKRNERKTYLYYRTERIKEPKKERNEALEML